ncbi:iron-sulfur cluster carrier protein ApbC [Vibrio parahaemolyticus]|uniref:iron-sulfur cluster carrier protein ApbC n=1 Tax=Vibrio parahaemolyticus TaxID=670 RepID=UPI00041A37D3|nr:iron-sulfur cluster carrier protein ApbC [Vibrio parahaemolyticus]EGQ7945629.1 iron-sulfur cluster carrier protein ApbC [Vibrio parahaemolyticus]EHH2461046.1 iron-sulfur cluster carrier protein ApbC [Vibrio parahaemolyticus]MBE3907292.1 iron-sulfur cluster carrier protein ApbC [Vibrio parahaemolyticus]MDF4594688.1 iron-sulfur cluster carrier protein ApbC [Vibrio parahaemolyticus]TOC40321.1 Fe-S-binding ATPase [Vibrio parahaemolyticus]
MHQFTSKQDFCHWFNQFQHPQLVENWADIHGVVTITAQGEVKITLPFASNELQRTLQEWIQQQQASKAVAAFPFHIELGVKALETQVSNAVKGVKNIIAVSSAKGGVGKSTTAVNLALAIAQSGAKVGLLDADIYGPSVPMMLGQEDAKPEVRDGKWMEPIFAHGIYTHSIGYLVNKSEAAIWRGPMASKALAQLLNETDWPDLDYLVIDMPPGTGDIQLTLSQQIPVTGAVLVTTPQDLALADARKGAAMFNKVNVPVVGVVENMSYHICSQCGATEHIFGMGGAEKMSQEFGLALLGQIPLHISMREDIDAGVPTVVRRPDSEHSGYYKQLADRVCSTMFWQGKAKPDAISFTMVN